MQWQSQRKWMFRQGVDALIEVLGHTKLKAVQRYRVAAAVNARCAPCRCFIDCSESELSLTGRRRLVLAETEKVRARFRAKPPRAH